MTGPQPRRPSLPTMPDLDLALLSRRFKWFRPAA